MSRVQLALNVDDIDEAVAFYSKLFDTEPAKRRPGYANFAIAEPPLKLVLLENPGQGGTLNHLGVEVVSEREDDAEHPSPGSPEPARPTIGLIAELVRGGQDVSARALGRPRHLTEHDRDECARDPGTGRHVLHGRPVRVHAHQTTRALQQTT